MNIHESLYRQIANTCGHFGNIGSPKKANFLSHFFCLLVLGQPVFPLTLPQGLSNASPVMGEYFLPTPFKSSVEKQILVIVC